MLALLEALLDALLEPRLDARLRADCGTVDLVVRRGCRIFALVFAVHPAQALELGQEIVVFRARLPVARLRQR